MSESESNPSDRKELRELISDAIRYWEPRRLVYKAILAVIISGYFAAYLPDSKTSLSIDGLLVLFLLAVLANGFYCAAHFVDLFAQYSAFRIQWGRLRSALFVAVVGFAAILPRFSVPGVFSSPIGPQVTR